MHAAIETCDLRKVYQRLAAPKRGGAAAGVLALDGLDLEIGTGEFFGLLGPNGAGKTTTIGILTTRVRPTGGAARVVGEDVIANPTAVRARIGVVPQRPNPDRAITVLENLVFHARYFGVTSARARQKAAALLERFGLVDKATSRTDALSGGQLQRLMVARALMHDPDVVFLDEPSAGLDPQSRLDLWEMLRSVQRQGRTVVMSTHYMEEAERLCDRVAIIDHGKLLACDAPDRLKARAPGETIVELTLDGPAEGVADRARAVEGVARAETIDARLRVFSARGGEVLSGLLGAVEAGGRAVRDVHLSRPGLENLFVGITGRRFDE